MTKPLLTTMPKSKPAALAIVPEAFAECNHLYTLAESAAAQAKDLAERAAHYAVLLGIRLKTIKENTPHGGWQQLFTDRGGKSKTAFTFSYKTAQNYMRAAESLLARDAVTARDKKAITALADTEAELTKDDHALLNKATDGHTLSQLYLDLGITPKRKPVIPQKIHTPDDDDSVETTDAPTEADDVEALFYTPVKKISDLFNRKRHLALRPAAARRLDNLLRSFVDEMKLLK